MNFSHFEGLYAGERIDPLTVCHIPIALASMLGAKRGRVLLSRETIDKQKAHHPDLTIEDYKALRPCLMLGEYRQDTPLSAVIVFTDAFLHGCNYRAAIKSTRDGRLLYCLSFNKLRDRQLAKERRSADPIIKAHN